ncbi:MAG: hypothetical protein IPP88_24300 [Betaproteobacteria bacterium]|nr:hypothetical protein [Betaproteobacteria bacterium]
MEYSVAKANCLLGKRVVVSLRHIGQNNQETYSGLWGVIDSVHENGLLLKVEGGIDETFWMLPPDLDALQPPSKKYYQLDGHDTIVTDVDYEAYFSIADSVERLNSRR